MSSDPRDHPLPVPPETAAWSPAPSRRAAALVAAAALAPLLLGVHALWRPWDFDASRQIAWTRLMDARAHGAGERLGRPRVVIAGGSSVAFGFNARRLSEALGVPVITYSTHAALGLDLIAQRAAALCDAGDVLVLAPEIRHFLAEPLVDHGLRADFLADHAGLLAVPPAERLRQPWDAARGRAGRVVNIALDGWAAWAGRGFRPAAPAPPPISPYLATGVDELGVVTAPRPGPSPTLSLRRLATDPAAYDLERSVGRRGLDAMARLARERGFAWYQMPSPRIADPALGEPGEAELRAREGEVLALAERLGARRLMDPGAPVLGPELAFDAVFHLNDAGVAALEPRMAEALRRVLPGRAP